MFGYLSHDFSLIKLIELIILKATSFGELEKSGYNRGSDIAE